MKRPEDVAKLSGLNIERQKAFMLCAKMSRDGYLRKSDNTTIYSLKYEGIEFICDGGYTMQRKREEEETEKQKELVNTGIRSNKWSPIWAALATLFALASVAISWFSYKESSHEQTTPAILRIDTTLRLQSQIQENLLQEMKSVKLEIYRLKDSLSKKP